MNEPIRVNVDLTNPGQFFACCGLLELANRLWPGAEGSFAKKDFLVSCRGHLSELLDTLVRDLPEELTTLENGVTVKRLIAPLRFSFGGSASVPFTLDAWMTISSEKGKAVATANRPWNFWSGQQRSKTIWEALRNALVSQRAEIKQVDSPALFFQRMPLTGRFGFDPGAAWNALDVGFSPNTQQMPVASSPATELLAAVGIQRFRPVFSEDKSSFSYSTWGQPLLPAAAAAAASGLVTVEPAVRLRGRVVDRGQYAALSYSTILKGASNG